jgi:hypothetical protein
MIGLGIANALNLLGCTNVNLKSVPPKLNTIKMQIQNYCPKAGFTFVDSFFYNSSASFNINQWTSDTDRDGLSDTFERLLTNFSVYGTNFLLADTVGNGYSDLVKVRLNLNAQSSALLPNCASPSLDTDGDGLSDCEENVLGTDSTLADSDLDGIPDGLEIRFGLNPTNPKDAANSITGDGLTNLQKVKMGVSIDTNLDSASQGLMTVYSSQASPTDPSCFQLGFTNINLVPVNNGNLFQVVIVEDNQTPPIGGKHSVDRQVRNLTVLVPSTIAGDSTIIVPDGVHGQFIDGVKIPLVVQGASGS